jgi:hypothetical protein
MRAEKTVTAERANLDHNAVAVPGYRLLEKIGEGGMGTVYRATQLSLQRAVAVKVLHAPASGAGADPAFQREARSMAALAHPNVVTIYDCGQVDGRHYLVTEYVPGCTLRSLIKPSEPWPIHRAAVVLDRIADALGYIHTNQLLHLDLKPENVLCGPDGEVKLTDFGLARTHVDARTLCERGQGTFDYCSLEQRSGLQTDARSDLFALAVLAYELLTGYLPGRVYEPASQLNPRLPRAVDEVLRRGLARRPEHRHPSVSDFRRDLLCALRPRKRPYLLAGAAVLALLGIAVAVVKFGGRAWQPGAAPDESPAGADMHSVPSWLLYDRPESLAWLGAADEEAARREFVGASRLRVEGPIQDGPSAPPVPAWPAPRPVFVWRTSKATGFFHPLQNPARGWKLLSRCAVQGDLPPIKSEDNYVGGGDFAAADTFGNGKLWRPFAAVTQANGDSVTIATPPDRPGNSALLLVKKDTNNPGRPVGCYQWLARIPARPGVLTVLRYRARAEEGSGRLIVAPRLPLTLPRADHSSLAERLRDLTVPHRELTSKPDADVREYHLLDAVAPEAGWRTYYTIWEWPPYCREAFYRNLEITYTGLGRVWVDDIELFPWEEGGEP